jgi:hypothetical protein
VPVAVVVGFETVDTHDGEPEMKSSSAETIREKDFIWVRLAGAVEAFNLNIEVFPNTLKCGADLPGDSLHPFVSLQAISVPDRGPAVSMTSETP